MPSTMRPALDPYLYRFPGVGEPPTAVTMQLGQNRNTGPGGPHDAANAVAIPSNFDVPRVLSGTNSAVAEPHSTFTAIIGDPRNDENLIVSQLHHAMLKFHNQVVDLLVTCLRATSSRKRKRSSHNTTNGVWCTTFSRGCVERRP